jgi:hypothetical protein
MADKAFLRLCDTGDDVAIQRFLDGDQLTDGQVRIVLITLGLAKSKYYIQVVLYAQRRNLSITWAKPVRDLEVMNYHEKALELFDRYGPFTQDQRDLIAHVAEPNLLEHVVQFSLSMDTVMTCLQHQTRPTIIQPLLTQFRLVVDAFIVELNDDREQVTFYWQTWNRIFNDILERATDISNLNVLETTLETVQDYTLKLEAVRQRIDVEDNGMTEEEFAEEQLPRCVSVETAAFWLDHGGRVEEINDLVFGALHTRYLIYSNVRRPAAKQALLDEYPALSGYIQNLQTTMRLRTPLPSDMIKHIYDHYLHE